MQNSISGRNGLLALSPLLVFVCIYLILGSSVSIIPETDSIEWILLIPYLLVIGLALSGVNVLAVLGIGITANNTIAIITVGGIASDISKRFGLDPKKVASILDTFSCIIQGIIPYGAQLLLASGLAGITAFSISSYLYYPVIMGLCSLLAILFRFPRKL